MKLSFHLEGMGMRYRELPSTCTSTRNGGDPGSKFGCEGVKGAKEIWRYSEGRGGKGGVFRSSRHAPLGHPEMNEK